MTRVAWVTPGYPPNRGGVSDHSGAMVSELRALGHEVLVCSNPQERGFAQLDAELDSYRPKAIMVAYVPLGFAPHSGGIAPAFAAWCLRLRKRRGVSTLLLAHEVNLPVRGNWRHHELKLALLGTVHIAQFELLARCFTAIVFSHEGNRAIWARRLLGVRGRLHTIRICSSVPLVESGDARAELAAAGYRVPVKPVVFFGTGHESVLFDYVEAALLELLKVEPEARLIIVGMDEAKLRRSSPALSALGASVQALGFVSSRDVSLWLQVAEIVLAPLAEGANARKTTIMAAFQHGRPVVTTRGFHTRDDIPWSQICALARLDPGAFAATAVQCFADTTRRASLAKAAAADYWANASARITAAQLQAYAGLGRAE